MLLLLNAWFVVFVSLVTHAPLDSPASLRMHSHSACNNFAVAANISLGENGAEYRAECRKL